MHSEHYLVEELTNVSKACKAWGFRETYFIVSSTYLPMIRIITVNGEHAQQL